VAVPTITSITPNYGANEGGTSMTIVGTNYEAVQGTGTVTVGGIAVTGYTSWGDLEIVCTTPPNASGDAVVIVTNDSADSSVPSFIAASWASICTDGTFEEIEDVGWTEVATDGIFSWGGFIYTGTGSGIAVTRRLICSVIDLFTGVGRVFK